MKLDYDTAVRLLFDCPVIIGREYGFDKLTELHNTWMRSMICGKEDETLQGHRGSYKTTCLSISLACICVGMPWLKTVFMRKTDDDVKEIIAQTKKILRSDVMRSISFGLYGKDIVITTDNANEINTNLAGDDPRGTSQITAYGIGASITGKHYDRIFTDDIVNAKDRISRAEREKTKLFYQELQNVKNRGGRIYNTGTPWHKDDAFLLMPNPKVYDCYSTGLISDDELEHIKERMTSSLFAANYEMRHIASDDVIFKDPVMNADASMVEQGECHLDAAYGGSDYTAFTICRKVNGIYYVYGRLWRQHVDDVQHEIIALRKRFNAGRINCEDNADKGYLKKELKAKGERVHSYHESMNKFLKVTSYLKAAWKNVVFVEGTDDMYIKQVCDYNIDAEHDDAPDSLASMVRILYKQDNQQRPNDSAYLMYL